MNSKPFLFKFFNLSFLLFTPALYANAIWLEALGEESTRNTIRSVEVSAQVVVSDGSKYQTDSSWQSPEYVIFSLQYPDRKTRLGKEGFYYWSANDKEQKDASEALRDFILGHQFHAELIFPKHFVSSFSKQKIASSECDCFQIGAVDLEGNQVEYHVDKKAGQLMIKVIHNKKHGKIENRYSDWKKVNGLTLPTNILISHAGRKFEYAFKAIKFNTDELYKSLRTAYETLNDEQKIRRLHQDMMDAHIHSDASLMNHIWADEITMVNRGNINVVSGEAASQRMASSLSRRKHTEYVDLQLPKVVLSNDHTLAHLFVRVRAKGNGINAQGKLGKQFEFTSAWIATFKKTNGEWKMSANASNFE